MTKMHNAERSQSSILHCKGYGFPLYFSETGRVRSVRRQANIKCTGLWTMAEKTPNCAV
jgi:hypothetical protein